MKNIQTRQVLREGIAIVFILFATVVITNTLLDIILPKFKDEPVTRSPVRQKVNQEELAKHVKRLNSISNALQRFDNDPKLLKDIDSLARIAAKYRGTDQEPELIDWIQKKKEEYSEDVGILVTLTLIEQDYEKAVEVTEVIRTEPNQAPDNKENPSYKKKKILAWAIAGMFLIMIIVALATGAFRN